MDRVVDAPGPKYERLLDYIDTHAEALYRLLLDYLAVKSENHITHGEERACAELVYRHWQALGLNPDLYAAATIPEIKNHEGFLSGRDSENRPNVTACLPGSKPRKKIMLLAHTDTTPIGEPSAWTVNPLGEMKDGKIYGRGAGDNKFGLAVMTFLVRMFAELGVGFADDLLVTAYADEEYGGGNGALAACLAYPCDAYINLDGGNFEIWNIALGGWAIQFDAVSRVSLDSSQLVAQALYTLMEALSDFGQRRREELGRIPAYAGSAMQRSAFRVTGLKAGELGTDLNHGFLQCSVYTDRPKEVIEAELEAILSKVRPAADRLNVDLRLKPVSRYFDYATTKDDLGLIPAIKRAGKLAAGRDLKVAGSCLTDLNILLRYGSQNSLNFGIFRDFNLPGGAHQHDEFVDCRELLDFTKTLAVFIADQCGMQEALI